MAVRPAPPVDRIRPQVRAEKEYRVATPDGISCKLNQNESPFDLDPDLKEEILREMRAVPFNRYPEDQPSALVRALAASIGVRPEYVLVGNGSNELTHTLGLSLVAGGNQVVLPRPMFGLFASMVRIFGGVLTSVGPRDDLSFDVDALVEAIESRDPSLVVVATPNNPTGLEVPHDGLLRIVRAARGFVVVDEAYFEFASQPDAVSLIDEYPNIIVMRTLSKGFGLAGLRLGYLVARPEVIGELLKARLPFMVGELAQRTAIHLLRRPEIIRRRVGELQESTRWISARLAEMGLDPVPSNANFVIFKSPVAPGELLRRVAASGVLIRDMSGYPELDRYVRVCAGTTDENKAFLTALKRALS